MIQINKQQIKEILLKKENMAVIVLSGILLLVIAIPIKKDQDDNSRRDSSSSGENGFLQQSDAMEEKGGGWDYTEEMEKKVEEILSCMEGVGDAKVMITLKSSEEVIVEKEHPAVRNSLTEQDGSGTSRVSSEYQDQETTIYTTDENGNKIPYVIKTVEPEIEGVTVVAKGGGNATVQKNISEVIQALFHIEAHKIKVVKMR